MKYKVGDFVSKPVTGICKIEDILYLTPQDDKKLYYLMKPTSGIESGNPGNNTNADGIKRKWEWLALEQLHSCFSFLYKSFS